MKINFNSYNDLALKKILELHNIIIKLLGSFSMMAIDTMYIFSWMNTCTDQLGRVKMLMINIEGYLQGEENKKGEFARKKY